MYYISKDTFDKLDEGLQKEVLKDTKEYAGVSEEEKKEVEQPEMSLKEKADAKVFEDNKSAEDEKNKTKKWDDAHEKGMSLIIGVGKAKPKKEKEEEEEDNMES